MHTNSLHHLAVGQSFPYIATPTFLGIYKTFTSRKVLLIFFSVIPSRSDANRMDRDHQSYSVVEYYSAHVMSKLLFFFWTEAALEMDVAEGNGGLPRGDCP